MELHTGREFESDRLQGICLESDLLCPLSGPVHVGRYGFGREFHIYIRDVRHALAVVIHLHRQLFTLVVGTYESLFPFICVTSRKMSDDEALGSGQFRILLCEEAFVSGVLCTVVADLCQRLAVLHLCDGVGA